MARAAELSALGEDAHNRLRAVHDAREEALPACRETIRACGLAIRGVHRHLPDELEANLVSAESSLRRAQAALAPFPSLAVSGFLADAEKEFAEANLTAALVGADPLPTDSTLGVGLAPWLNGLAEAASELRRHLLDELRAGRTRRAEDLLVTMEDVYDMLITVDFPDAVTGGLRRTTDALRAVVERSRSDVTITVLQGRLQRAIEESRPSG
jgi:translin